MIEFSIAKQSAKEPGKEAAKRPGAGGLGIRTKLLLAFAGVAALTLLGSGVALVSYGHVNGAFERVTGVGLPAITNRSSSRARRLRSRRLRRCCSQPIRRRRSRRRGRPSSTRAAA
jgi:hypothetical protein